MTTTTPRTASPYQAPLLPTDGQPIAMLATTRHSPVREMTEFLTRRYGPGLQVRRERGRTVWLVPAGRKQVAR